jgi:hypothetical protein
LTALRSRAAEGSAFARYAQWRTRDFRARGRVCGLVSLLVDISPLARCAAARLQRYPDARGALMDAIGGIGAPQRALGPAVLGRLLV